MGVVYIIEFLNYKIKTYQSVSAAWYVDTLGWKKHSFDYYYELYENLFPKDSCIITLYNIIII